LGFVAHGFVRHPVLAWGFYGALIGVGVAHVVWGWGRWVGWLPAWTGSGSMTGDPARVKRTRRRWWVMDGFVVLVAGLWAAGGLGVVARGGPGEGWVGKGWDELYERVPLLKL